MSRRWDTLYQTSGFQSFHGSSTLSMARIYQVLVKKKPRLLAGALSMSSPLGLILHQVGDQRPAVVDVGVLDQRAETLGQTLGVGVGHHRVSGLEADLRGEGVLVHGAEQLQRDVGAVEEALVAEARASVADRGVLAAA